MAAESWDEVDISSKELVPVVIVAATWGKCFTSKQVCFLSDNLAVMASIGSRTAKSSLLMHLLCYLSSYCAYYQFHCPAKHILGPLNSAADAILFNNLTLFSSLAPEVPHYNPPLALIELLVVTKPD